MKCRLCQGTLIRIESPKESIIAKKLLHRSERSSCLFKCLTNNSYLLDEKNNRSYPNQSIMIDDNLFLFVFTEIECKIYKLDEDDNYFSEILTRKINKQHLSKEMVEMIINFS